ncbi:prephenate dehydrogenase [Geosporobacter subterraneus DSM 17957]|uniref:Prephenate dehydrogenase n=1 Tax=Geosporobacter subterraneus DSM 17957 TaxID=1121919 RepID=A0A1M6IWA3_9FIRM|nr:prephenate dehydrogenase [Geosporobacter subterraneus]SHJ38743.1 prephenate dehydrogenase [Geosporobacter subterraneus DSM 17957]
MDFFNKITFIGLGLIGGSMAAALKRRGYKGEICGYDALPDSREEAKKMGIIDHGANTLQEAVAEAELVVLCTPIAAYPQILRKTAPFLRREAILTDVGSVKGCVGELVNQHVHRDIQFIGGHPMAGSEKGGLKAASATLFENAYYFLTPGQHTARETVTKLESFVKAIGAYPVVVGQREHDKITARISHIPHLAAVLLTNLLDHEGGINSVAFAGGGFRDTTRIASGNPAMWKDIFFYNKEEILLGIESLESMLKEFRELLKEKQEGKVLDLLNKAKFIRDGVPKGMPDYMPPLFDIVVDVEDRPGVLGELTRLIGENHMNIKEIEILHAREGEQGAVRMGFATAMEQKQAFSVLRGGGFPRTYMKGEKNDAYSESC